MLLSLLIEEALVGDELSFIVLADGHDFAPLVPTRDHKEHLMVIKAQIREGGRLLVRRDHFRKH